MYAITVFFLSVDTFLEKLLLFEEPFSHLLYTDGRILVIGTLGLPVRKRKNS